MKVSELMEKSVITVTEETPIKEVGRIIFNLGISGIPVVRGKKLIGIVTEKDLLSHMFPSMQELAEDYIHARDFSEMEKNLKDLLQLPVKKIMNKNVTSIPQGTPIMEAQSLMLINKFSRITVVDKEEKLVGIVSQGDIFRHLIRDEIPQLEKEKYADFIARYYDKMVNWKTRFNSEFPTLISLFKKEEVSSVIDLGVWTGEYTIGLAKASKLKLIGLDHNESMIKISEQKKDRLNADVRKRLKFKLTNFERVDQEMVEKYDAAICMGNSLPYIPVSPEILFPKISKTIRDNNGLMVLQVLNFRKIIESKGKLLNFRIQRSDSGPVREHLFIEFFETLTKDCVFHHIVVFDFDGLNWIYRGLTTIEVCERSKEELEKTLKRSGFKDISFSGNSGEYQGEYGSFSLTKPFDIKEDDWLNVVAKR